MTAMSALFHRILRPMNLFALAQLAEITSKGVDFKESQQGEEFADTILNGGAFSLDEYTIIEVSDTGHT